MAGKISTKKSKKEVAKEVQQPKVSLYREAGFIFFFLIGIFVCVAIGSHYLNYGISDGGGSFKGDDNILGIAGSFLALILTRLLGFCSFVISLWFFILSYSILRGGDFTDSRANSGFLKIIGSVCLAVSCSGFFAIVYGRAGGGVIGFEVASFLVQYSNQLGASLVTFAVMLLSLIIATGLSFSSGAPRIRMVVEKFAKKLFNYIFNFTRIFIVYLYSNSVNLLSGTYNWIRDKFVDSNDELVNDRFVLGRSIKKKDSTPYQDIFNEFSNDQAEEDLDEEDAIFPDEYEDDEEDEEYYDSEIENRRVAFRQDDSFVPTIKKRDFSDSKLSFSGSDLSSKIQKKGALVNAKRKNSRLDYKHPSSELLVAPEEDKIDLVSEEELIKNSRRLEQALFDFKVSGRVIEVHPGPIITLYEFEPAPGVKVNRVVTLADDLALALKVSSVRVYAPVPGKGTVGIEVPNRDREIVRLKEVIDSKSYVKTNNELALALGKDTFGEPFVADLSAMPHLLIAGATGTGKSVCVNSLVLSLLFNHSPDQLKLIMIDPKMLELSVYEEIAHLLTPVITVPKRAKGALWWAVEEMERRYDLMKRVGVRNLAGYNEYLNSRSNDQSAGSDKSKSLAEEIIELSEADIIATEDTDVLLSREGGESYFIESEKKSKKILVDSEIEPLPRIVIIVDELADLMLTVGREIEELLTRLAQKARAAGIHLILATQRPSVNVITGLIKANFPARISFKVASKIDARTVLDTSGSEKLLGQGDMLFMSPTVGRLKRLHSAYVSDQEVHKVVTWIKSQGEAEYDPKIEEVIERFERGEDQGGGDMMDMGGEIDPLYDQAVNLVLQKGAASTSLVQRYFRIGYNRAARIIEMMEHEGVVGPADGAKPRQILVQNQL